jgi:hypothetical protein
MTLRTDSHGGGATRELAAASLVVFVSRNTFKNGCEFAHHNLLDARAAENTAKM